MHKWVDYVFFPYLSFNLPFYSTFNRVLLEVVSNKMLKLLYPAVRESCLPYIINKPRLVIPEERGIKILSL